jgi:hypothetical protein
MDRINLLALLRYPLKSDEIFDLLERYTTQVIYTFHRPHEGIDDCYWADARNAGFQLHFDENQILDTIFCYIKEGNGFHAIDTLLIGVPIYRTLNEGRQSVAEQGLSFSSPDTAPEDHFQRWLHIDLPRASIRYQFSNGELDLITLASSF